MTKIRNGVCGTIGAMLIDFGSRRSMSRYSGNDSYSQRNPAFNVSSRIPSTNDSVSIARSRSAARTGATPNPQLPCTTVVTPCHDDGLSVASHEHLGVVVRVDVDESGRKHEARQIDLDCRRIVANLADGNDHAVAERNINPKPRLAGAIDHGRIAKNCRDRTHHTTPNGRLMQSAERTCSPRVRRRRTPRYPGTLGRLSVAFLRVASRH